ncbi:MAG TPA: hypothetical protein VG267_22345 [Terracidiphilus sp.]|jgi:hypothetical protein|nr:hypothetical protein [Terracidiphilus sp.]
MHLPRNLFAVCAVVGLSLPAFAGVTVNSPSNDSTVYSPFKLSASASTCSSQNVTAMGYSFDSSSSTTVVDAQSIDRSVDSSTGNHTLHVKAWGANGASCVEDVVIDVKSGGTTSTSSSEIPSDAKGVSHIQALSGWKAVHDSGGSGSSSGSTTIVSSPSLYGSTRRYETSFSNSGDERFSISFADDVYSENFFYDTWVYLDGSGSEIGNLEFDVNQVMADGKTVLVGVQCDGYTGHWAYTVNTGSASDVKPRWYSKSTTSCNPRDWSRDKWHHMQFNFSRNSSGYISYHNIWLDGKESSIGATAFGAADLGWGPTINTQFQIDGMGSGTIKAYLDNLTISRW